MRAGPGRHGGRLHARAAGGDAGRAGLGDRAARRRARIADILRGCDLRGERADVNGRARGRFVCDGGRRGRLTGAFRRRRCRRRTGLIGPCGRVFAHDGSLVRRSRGESTRIHYASVHDRRQTDRISSILLQRCGEFTPMWATVTRRRAPFGMRSEARGAQQQRSAAARQRAPRGRLRRRDTSTPRPRAIPYRCARRANGRARNDSRMRYRTRTAVKRVPVAIDRPPRPFVARPDVRSRGRAPSAPRRMRSARARRRASAAQRCSTMREPAAERHRAASRSAESCRSASSTRSNPIPS
ncbi:DsbB family disulfide bond formation protein [Burkholderia pseudomallei]|nr:DsbB family disulfide bond formation protein [Burkholderia pseudomallei]CAJ3936234.1 DsbB family disulfide bond formation protein [Burkholderia pseudomallei]CAJ4984988.1 DsbB family disulfide bond formation protein [Burkholderia pseudomallei]CAJ5282609.1 DsbB family disulfide bond formation protein [Burkholderia pseudomallei]CAJ5723544.1 DsbB family disulfide bond formation protein [Burkholderia pseudomallei]